MDGALTVPPRVQAVIPNPRRDDYASAERAIAVAAGDGRGHPVFVSACPRGDCWPVCECCRPGQGGEDNSSTRRPDWRECRATFGWPA